MRYGGVIYKAPKHKCKGCDRRYLGCHDHCEDYINARAEFLAEWHQIMSNRAGDSEIDRYQADQVTRQIRRKK